MLTRGLPNNSQPHTKNSQLHPKKSQPGPPKNCQPLPKKCHLYRKYLTPTPEIILTPPEISQPPPKKKNLNPPPKNFSTFLKKSENFGGVWNTPLIVPMINWILDILLSFFSIFFEGAQNSSFLPGARYPRYATDFCACVFCCCC